METIVPKAPPPRRWAILMDVAGLQAVRAQLDGPRRKAAHTAACTALNQCADDSRELAVDMATEPWWKNFIASQGVADQMAAVGITGFSAKRVLGFKDPDGHDRTRVEFFVYVADGSHWRLHPRPKPFDDAIPLHFLLPRRG